MAGLREFAQLYVRALCACLLGLWAYWTYRYLAGGYNPLDFVSSRYFWLASLGGLLSIVAAAVLFRAVKAEKRIALSLMAFLFFMMLVDFLIVYVWFFVGGFGTFFGDGLLHKGLRETLLPYAVPAFGLGLALTLLLYAKGWLAEPSQNWFLRRIEPTWTFSLPELVYWSLLFVWIVLCVGPLGDFFYYKLEGIVDVLQGKDGFANIAAGLVLPIAFVIALSIRSGAAALFVIALYVLNSGLNDLLRLDILPERLEWKYLIRSPLVLGMSLVAVLYLINRGCLSRLVHKRMATQ
jgi:hypothetical protein